MKTASHSEAAFESVIEAHLLANGYRNITSRFDRARAIFPDEIIGFIRDTQPEEWGKLEALHAKDTAAQVLTDLCKWMDTYGALHTLRHGFKCYGRTLRVAYFKAAHGPAASVRRGTFPLPLHQRCTGHTVTFPSFRFYLSPLTARLSTRTPVRTSSTLSSRPSTR